MGNKALSRRNFIQKTLAAGVALTGISSFQSCSGFNARGLPTVVFGKTGVRMPRISIGLGSRFCGVGEDEAQEILAYALDNGIFYFDTAYSYTDRASGAISEERVGKIAKDRRKEIFISTKVQSRDPNEAMKQIETSLKRLQTDYLDNLMIHSVSNIADVEEASKPGGVIELVTRLKEEGVTKFIGFSSHSDADASRLMIGRGDFDTVLLAINQQGNHSQKREELVIPAAVEKNLGIMLMKSVRPVESVPEISANQLIRYSLSLEGPAVLTLGMDSVAIVRSNLDIMRHFTPMTPSEMSATASALSPFFNNKNLEWNRPGYRDGHWG
jgi:uncharacterized protein